MSGSGGGLSSQEIAAKEAQERELKAALDRVEAQGDMEKAPSHAPSNVESSGDSSSNSDSNSDSSDED
jgi:hypothetical protein